MATRTPASPLRSATRRVDAAALGVAITALAVYLLHGFDGRLSRDLGVYLYAGQRFADGDPPYVGVMNRAGPLAHALPGVGIAIGRVFSIDDVVSARGFFLLLAVLTVTAAYVVGRDVFSSRLAGLSSAAAMLCFHGFIEYAAYGPREKTPMVLFLTCAFAMLPRGRLVAAGVFLGLSTLVWQPAFLVALAVGITTASFAPRKRLRALAEVVVGGAIPAVLCCLYFLVTGAFSSFLDGFLLVNAQYTRATAFTSRVEETWDDFVRGYGASLPVLLIGVVAVLALAVLAVARRPSRTEQFPMITIGAGTAVAIAWTLHDVNGWPDLFVLFPGAAVGIGGLARQAGDRLPGRTGLLVGCAWVALGGVLAVWFSVTERHSGLDDQRSSVAAVLDNMPADATMASVAAPQAMALADRENPTPYQMFAPAIRKHIEDTWPGGIAGFADDLRDDAPSVLAVKHVTSWLEPVLHDYRHVGGADGWEWYLHDSVDPATVQAVETALSRS